METESFGFECEVVLEGLFMDHCTVAGRVFLKSAFYPWSFLALKLSISELESWFFVYRDIFFIGENPTLL